MKHDEISSTEKLLDLIRTDSSSSPPPATPETKTDDNVSPQVLENSPRPLFRFRGIGKGEISIGVDFGYQNIRLVKMVRGSGGGMKLVDYCSHAYDADTPKDSPKFRAFFTRVMQDFCGAYSNKMKIWCGISIAHAEVRYLLVPKVPSHQLDKTVRWAFKKAFPFQEREFVFDFDVLDDVVDQGVTKTGILASVAMKKDVAALQELFEKCGYPVTGISLPSFAIQNLQKANWLSMGNHEVICKLSIGLSWSRIDIFAWGQLVMVRAIKTGVLSMAEELGATNGNNDLLLSFTDDNVGESSEPMGTEHALEVLSSPEMAMRFDPQALSESEIFDRIEPVVSRLVRQLERTFEYFVTTFNNDRITRLRVSGLFFPYEKLVGHLGEQLSVPCDSVDPFSSMPPNTVEAALPRTASERSSYVTAAGLALSDNSHTPNYLFTRQKKMTVARDLRVERGILTVFFVLAALCGIFYYHYSDAASQNAKEIKRLESQLKGQVVLLDKGKIVSMADELKAKRIKAKTYGRRYGSMAVLSELTAITPENISLSSCVLNFGPAPADIESGGRKGKKDSVAGRDRRTMLLNGVVRGHEQVLNADLTMHLLQIKNSSFFDRPEVSNLTPEVRGKDKVLSFSLSAELLPYLP